MERHFTATAFVVERGRTLLHWHRKLGQWMPPGGHLLAREDPVTGVLREVKEETGIEAEVLPLTPAFPFDYPRQIAAPYTILVESSAGPAAPHEHIDLIYFCRPKDGATPDASPPDDTLVWVSEDQLRRNDPLPRRDGEPGIRVADDVRVLALEALRVERDLSRTS